MLKAAINKDLDALRGVAMLMVFWAHWASSSLTPALGGLEKYFVGYYGVDIFFAVSGYLITASLVGLLASQPTGTALAMFGVRRIFRTVAPAMLWLAVWVCVSLAIGNSSEFGIVSNNLRHAGAAILQVANLYMHLGCAGGCGIFGYYWSDIKRNING